MSTRTKLDNYTPRPKWIRYLLGYFALFIGSVLTKINVKGRHFIPQQGPYIVAVIISVILTHLLLYMRCSGP